MGQTPRALSDSILTGLKTFVGREAALTELKGTLNKALQGQRQIIFITGEAGVGKTTLVDVFQQTATFGADAKIVRGQCVEGFAGKEAYYPILEALGHLFRDANDTPYFQTFARQAPTWLVQFPLLVNSEQRDALAKEILGATRERIVREICEALEAITTQNPLVLWLEDLHWADTSTLDFVSALARRRGPAKLLLLGTYRPAEVIISQSPLKALKQDLVIHGLSQELSLERLAESNVAEYLAIEFPDADFPPGFVNVIYRHSGGNALFLVAILQDMMKKGLIANAEGRSRLTLPLESVDTSVPATLDQLIEAQFQQLTATEQRILRSASAVGDRFSVWTIATAAELEPESIEEVCQLLAEKLQFIKPAGVQELANGQISTHYEFQHSLYREVLYRRLSEINRTKLHRHLAERLKSLGHTCEQELASELALHFEGGRDHEQAIHYLILAAENSSRRLAHRDSIEILQHAQGLVAKVSSKLAVELEIRVFESIGDVHFAMGAMVNSSEAYGVAASRAVQAGLKAVQVRVLTRTMNPLGFLNPAQGIAALERAVEVGKAIGDPALLARTQLLAAAYRLVFDTWRQADVDSCTSAHETLRRLRDLSPRSYHRMIYAHVLTLQGNYREALEIFEVGISQIDKDFSAMARYIAVLGKTMALLEMGQLGEVLRIARTERELAEKNGSALGCSISAKLGFAHSLSIMKGPCKFAERSASRGRAILPHN